MSEAPISQMRGYISKAYFGDKAWLEIANTGTLSMVFTNEKGDHYGPSAGYTTGLMEGSDAPAMMDQPAHLDLLRWLCQGFGQLRETGGAKV